MNNVRCVRCWNVRPDTLTALTASSFLAITLVASLVSTVQADMTRKNPGINSTIVKASNQLAVGVGVLEQDYREFNDGLEPSLPDILDSESGSITSLRLSYTGMIRQLYVQANLNYSTGDTDYVGYLQSLEPPVVYTPFNTTTENWIVDVLVRVGYAFRTGASVVLIPYGEVGNYMWRRDVGPSTPYGITEDYFHMNFSLGAKALYSPVDRLVLELGSGYGTTFLGTMTLYGYDYELGNKPYMSAYASLDYRFVTNWHIKWSADYRKWEYGQSDVVAGFLEPHSRTEQTQYLMSVGYNF
jgi:hypothetical protein